MLKRDRGTAPVFFMSAVLPAFALFIYGGLFIMAGPAGQDRKR